MLAKKIFGDDHEICFDTIINHDVYDFFRISIEVPRDQSTEAFVLLNGREVGHVKVFKTGRQTQGYEWSRFVTPNDRSMYSKQGMVRKLGEAVAKILTDFAKE